MSYSTPAMVRLALVPSSNGAQPEPRSNTAADLSDRQIQDSINEADSTIDAMIGQFYTVPVVATMVGTAPHPIDYWSRNIAAYNATLDFRQGQDFTDQDPVARRYTATMQALSLVQQNKSQLQIPRQSGDSASEGAAPPINPSDRDSGALFRSGDFGLANEPTWQDVPNFYGLHRYW